MAKFKGRVWRFGDNVDTDQIIPAEYLTTGNPAELAEHAFAKVRPNFPSEVRKGDIIVGGCNFGSGSSREHAPRALMGAGISCVVAGSFARIFYRNSINIGLPLIQCVVDVEDGAVLEVDTDNGIILDADSGKEYGFSPLPAFLQELFDAGGLVNYVKRKMGV